MTETISDSTIDPSEREFGPSGISLSKYRFPTGWFIVGFASDLAPGAGQARPLLRRGTGDVPHRVRPGATCSTRTASTSARTWVSAAPSRASTSSARGTAGEWRGDGTNALIPYSKIGCKKNVRIRTYPSTEWYGFILVWHERHGRAPYWQPPVLPELETDEYYPLHPHTRMVNRVKVHAQMIIENAADPYHVQYVHKAANPATTASFEVSGYHLHATVNANFGGGRAKTWLTPTARSTPRSSTTTTHWAWGSCASRRTWWPPSRSPARRRSTRTTPTTSIPRPRFASPATPATCPPAAPRSSWQLQQEVIKQDFFTWENMKYLEKPNLAPEEARDYAALRRWAHRFYPGTEPSPDDFGYTADGEPDPAAAGA